MFYVVGVSINSIVTVWSFLGSTVCIIIGKPRPNPNPNPKLQNANLSLSLSLITNPNPKPRPNPSPNPHSHPNSTLDTKFRVACSHLDTATISQPQLYPNLQMTY